MNSRIYPNAPIVLMIAEVRFPEIPDINEADLRTISDALHDSLPELSDDIEVENIVEGNENGDIKYIRNEKHYHRWSAPGHRTTLEIHSGMMSLRTTDYPGYESMRKLLENAIDIVANTLKPQGFSRVGLRYVDEIRVPSQSDGNVDWSVWVSPSLLGPRELLTNNSSLAIQEGLFVIDTGDNSSLAIRYGHGDGYVIDSTPELRRPMPTPGPVFKLDFDSFQLDDYSKFDVENILAIFDSLHKPVHGFFESLISEKLRNEVLNNE